MIVKGGTIVAERYAEGAHRETPLLGWSVTKSVTSALVGILARRGQLSVFAPAPVAAWQNDARRAITIDDLLRMTSGLDIEETNTGFDPNTRILFLERDTAGAAIGAGIRAPAGHTWSYASGNTLILSRLVKDTVGDFHQFANDALFAPLGMTHVTFESDAVGTPLGSMFMLAPAREWARFGMLYANDGIAKGTRILPEGWVTYSRTQTLGGPYAAGFWRGTDAWRARWHVPEDLFVAAGSLGQRIVIVPSEKLVIARFGISGGPVDLDLGGLGLLIAEARAALSG